jgi:hypothetical protein
MSRADTPRGSFSFAYKSYIIYLQNINMFTLHKSINSVGFCSVLYLVVL